jgi:Zn finger protein HypA/HybF involved in hydrogenase expression
MDALMLDGNAVAGVLQEVFAVEMTTAMVTCNTCGATEPVGTLHVFRGAGIVMRCPHCDSVLMTIVKDDTRMWISSHGMRTLQVTV